MILPENDYQILKLTDAFYNDHPDPPYSEILKKSKRAYNCLIFQTHYNYFICVPYRSEIRHKYAFHFSKTDRSRKHRSGLDYTKIVIIDKLDYLGSKQAIIDRDEYKETVINIEQIKSEALKFVEDYIFHINGTNVLNNAEFKRRYAFSSLKYFHKELDIQ